MRHDRNWILLFFVAVISILIILEFLSYQAKDKFRHEVDYKVHLAHHTTQKNIDTILLSDSVTYEAMGKFQLNENILDLTSNQGISLAGNYFLLQRYLQQHKAPKEVFLFFIYGLFTNSLNSKYDYLYFTTVFTDKNEIHEIADYGKKEVYDKLDYFNIRKLNIKKYFQEYVPGKKAIFNRNYNLIKLQNKADIKISDKKIKVFAQAKLFPFANHFLQKIIDLCKDNDISLVLVVEPMLYEQHRAYVNSDLYRVLKEKEAKGAFTLMDANNYYQFGIQSFRKDRVHLGYEFQKKYLDIIDRHILKLFTDNYEKRISDLTQIRNALEAYYQEHGSYPKSKGFDGFYAAWGESGQDWIKGLVPAYMSELPRDPRQNSNPKEQYFYRSNGKQYKLIAHGVEDCKTVKSINPELIDPKRDCWAYGYWTAGAASW